MCIGPRSMSSVSSVDVTEAVKCRDVVDVDVEVRLHEASKTRTATPDLVSYGYKSTGPCDGLK